MGSRLNRRTGLAGAVALAAAMVASGTAAAVAAPAHTSHAGHAASGSSLTATPIKHVIVIIGENHSFDNVFATYHAPKGQHVQNLLSEGIVTSSGAPGPNFAKARQVQATDTGTYSLSPKVGAPYKTLPAPNTTYVSQACDGLPGDSTDTRFPAKMANGPFQITKYVPYFDSHLEYSQFGQCEFYGPYVGDPLHRFYQMWQQQTVGHGQLNTWVANTAGDDNGANPPSTIWQGAVGMGFYNIAQGDAPIIRNLAQHYAISDNYHQAVMGGTGLNHIALGTGYAPSYQNAAGQPVKPPAGQIENPNPLKGTNNAYTEDGYGGANGQGGGSYSECANPSAPGVSAIDKYLATLPYKPLANCKPGRYYILNNYNPGYTVTGAKQPGPFTVPPQKTDYVTIGNSLSTHKVSWGYYGEGYNNGNPTPNYCGICDPMQYSTSIMTNPALRKNTQHDYSDFITQAENGTLPAVSFLKPGNDDGHPGYSSLPAFENFTARAIAAVQSNPTLWKSTAIFVTVDESGGYYDSGYIEPVSFFGDGSRIPMIVVSPYARQDFIDHTYTDHVSILKFIEANWKLGPLTSYSEDNLPNATPGAYIPKVRPAIGNLFTLFNFKSPHFGTLALHPYKEPAPKG
jgi:phospholipase C